MHFASGGSGLCPKRYCSNQHTRRKGKTQPNIFKKKRGIFFFLGGRGGHSSICIYFYHHHTRSVFKTRYLFMGGPGPAHLMLSSRNSSRGSKAIVQSTRPDRAGDAMQETDPPWKLCRFF